MTILAAALSIGVLAAPTAQARVTFTAPQPVTLSGRQSGSDSFTAGGIKKVCPKVSFSGTLSGNSTSLELVPQYGEPTYSGCIASALEGLSTKYAPNGCAYLLHARASKGQRNRWRADVDIVCPPPYSMEWYVYESKEKFAQGNVLCTTLIRPQQDVGTAELSNTGAPSGGLVVRWNLTDIEYEAYGSHLLCGPVLTVRQDASYEGETVIAAKGPGARHIDFAISG